MQLNNIDKTDINIEEWSGAEVLTSHDRDYLLLISASGFDMSNKLLYYTSRETANDDYKIFWSEKEK